VITFDEFKIMMKKFLDEEIKSKQRQYSLGGKTLAVVPKDEKGGVSPPATGGA
jgi:hypothetical protein